MASLLEPTTESTATIKSTTEPSTTPGILYVPSPACLSVDVLFSQLQHLGGLSWSRDKKIHTVIISSGTHLINHLTEDASGATYTGVYLKGPHYAGLTIRGENKATSSTPTVLIGGLLLITGMECTDITFDNLVINNGDQAGWRSWMGNGLYIDDGATNIKCKECIFEKCEKLGIFVGDIDSKCILTDCIVRENNRGGIMASEGGSIDVLGVHTQIYDNAKFGVSSYMVPSLIKIYFDFDEETMPETVRMNGNKKGNVGESGGGKVVRSEGMLEN